MTSYALARALADLNQAEIAYAMALRLLLNGEDLAFASRALADLSAAAREKAEAAEAKRQSRVLGTA